jgi:hypothetical protein
MYTHVLTSGEFVSGYVTLMWVEVGHPWRTELWWEELIKAHLKQAI